MKRIYEHLLIDHFKQNRQAAFLSGPRQVGKTSIAQNLARDWPYSSYLSWDVPKDQVRFLSNGYEKILEGLPVSPATESLLVLDEIHKFADWKNYIKGLIDTTSNLSLLVTGSARLNVYKKGGDSLMGRYFHYRAHPLGVQEVALNGERDFALLKKPIPIEQDLVDTLLMYGGFPEPFLRQDQRFYTRWQTMRLQQLIYEDIRSLEAIQNLSSLETLATMLRYQSGQLVNYTNLASKIKVSVPTIQRWMNVLEQVYYCFLIRPWQKNISRSLIKEPKAYLCDWSVLEDKGARFENFVASHLLKAVHYWTDLGVGVFELYFIRTKDQKEVDFLVVKDGNPWFLCEVKSSGTAPLNKALAEMKNALGCPFAFQVAFDMKDHAKACDWLESNFLNGESCEPTIVPVSVFLSMLV